MTDIALDLTYYKSYCMRWGLEAAIARLLQDSDYDFEAVQFDPLQIQKLTGRGFSASIKSLSIGVLHSSHTEDIIGYGFTPFEAVRNLYTKVLDPKAALPNGFPYDFRNIVYHIGPEMCPKRVIRLMGRHNKVEEISKVSPCPN